MSLAGHSILVTRPQPKAQVLIDALIAAGATVQHLPTLAISPCTPSPAEKAFIENLDQYHAVIFVSSHSAHYGLQLMSDRWPQFPTGIHWVAVGPATGACIDSFHLSSLVPQGSSDSPGLLQLEELSINQIQGKKVLLVRGVGGLNVLSDGLLERGALVDIVEVYARQCPPMKQVESAIAQLQAEPCDVICSYSGESVINLACLLRDYQILHRQKEVDHLFKDALLLVISERVKVLAQAQGFKNVKVVEKASAAQYNALPLISADRDFYATISAYS